MDFTSVNSLSDRAGRVKFKTKSGWSIFPLIFVMLLPGIVIAQSMNNSSLEILLRIGVDQGEVKFPSSHQRSIQDNTITVLSSRSMKRPARFMRRVQITDTHIVIEGLDRMNNVVYKDSQIDPRLIRAEGVNKAGQMQRTDFYRRAANLAVVLPYDKRIVKLRLSLPRWNGVDFDYELMAAIPVRKIR